MSNVTRKFADFTTSLRFEDLPADVVHEAKRMILDVIGCGLGGINHEIGRIALEYVNEMRGAAEATVIGTGRKLPRLNAVYANSRIANALDMDDTYLGSGHFANGAVAASLALCEHGGGSGKDFITSFVAGYEIAGVVAAALVCQDIHPTGSATVVEDGKRRYAKWFSPAALVAASSAGSSIKGLGLDAERAYHALCITGGNTPIGTIRKWTETAKPLPTFKYCDTGWCAQIGLSAALLAQKGSTGLEDMYDGDMGVLAGLGVSPDFLDFSSIANELGKTWHLMKTSYKGWPSCRGTHSALTAFTKIFEDNKLKAEEIERVTIRGHASVASPRFAAQDPIGPVSSEFSNPHNVAMVSLRVGRADWHTPQTVSDKRVQELRRRVFVEIETDAERQDAEKNQLHKGMYIPPTVEVRARGQVYRGSALYAWGDPAPESRFTDDDIRAKFRDLALSVNPGSVSWGGRVERLIETVENLESLKNLNPLTMLLSPSQA
ncbi:MmgE/PrpD [Caballeronia udeis]|uniref:MmgE/PrpD n=1 Tax=Caballeronia udeis TaxID=1232866 RepID=A0A158IEJ0_9BURK|nr:MmgE/PrpD family protein [Caballeronia udeis]SAL54689.1 MmgE/PrpD [Caballeronia udeis]